MYKITISLILLISSFYKKQAQMENRFPNISFNSFHTTFDKTVFFADFTSLEIDKMLLNVPLEEITYLNKDDYRTFEVLENNYIIHVHEYLGGSVYKSLSDFLLYEKHFELDLKDAIINNKAFVTKKGLIISYQIEEISAEICDVMAYDFIRKCAIGLINDSIYVLPNNHSVHFLIFKNLNEFDLFLETSGKSILFGCNQFGNEVLKHKFNIIDKGLVERLNIPKLNLDYTPQSLTLIDESINKLDFEEKLFYEIFLGLILYLGDVLVLSNPDKYTWIIIDEGDETWSPTILDKKNNYKLPLSIYLYESIILDSTHSSYMRYTYDRLVRDIFNK